MTAGGKRKVSFSQISSLTCLLDWISLLCCELLITQPLFKGSGSPWKQVRVTGGVWLHTAWELGGEGKREEKNELRAFRYLSLFPLSYASIETPLLREWNAEEEEMRNNFNQLFHDNSTRLRWTPVRAWHLCRYPRHELCDVPKPWTAASPLLFLMR